VEEIATAVYDLSVRKIGAIVVLEREVALGEFIETGVRIEGKVTAEMLKTIFYPGTALHDMAVIIRGDRVVAARVQLPLAEAGSIDGYELGSRHRAAIGLTRGSDATVVVVSEETGTVSIAQGGQLWRGVSESELRKHLVGHISEGPRPILSWLRQFSRKKQATVSEGSEQD
jgi:diadenylate cyclase